VQVWPEHWHATVVFLGMGTQWRVTEPAPGAVQRHGLDYGALPPVLEACADAPHRQPLAELMRQLRVLERAALKAMDSEN
jgi:hypothetical protein